MSTKVISEENGHLQTAITHLQLNKTVLVDTSVKFNRFNTKGETEKHSETKMQIRVAREDHVNSAICVDAKCKFKW